MYMVTDRIMEKKHVQLRQAAGACVRFFHNWIFPHKGSKYPGSDPNIFFSIILGGGHYFHNWFFLWNQGARADGPVFP